MKKGIKQKNDKGELHGYQEAYNECDGSIRYRGTCKNGLDIGYQEYHDVIREREYYIR